MPKKLVLDRAVSIHLKDGDFAVVPEGEVWKVSSTTPLCFRLTDDRNASEYNSAGRLNVRTGFLVGAGVKIGPDTQNRYSTCITGLAFKVQEV